MQGPRDVEALRRRLYRPDASPEDVAAYAAVAEPEPEAAEAPGEPTARRWERLPLVLGVVALLVAGGVVANGLLQGAAPPSAAAPVRTVQLDPDDGLPARIVPVVDGGTRAGASGAAERVGTSGFLYTVARGDTVLGVARRFGLCTGDVLIALPYGADAGDLPAGQQITLVRARVGGFRAC
jgi:hypothetical protein